MKALRSIWRNRGLITLSIALALLLLFAGFVIFQQQIYAVWYGPLVVPPAFATETVQQGQSWTVIRRDQTNYTCVWKKDTSVPACLNLTPMQYSGAAGFAYVRSDDRTKMIFLFLFRTGKDSGAELKAQDVDTRFQIDSR